LALGLTRTRRSDRLVPSRDEGGGGWGTFGGGKRNCGQLERKWNRNHGLSKTDDHDMRMPLPCCVQAATQYGVLVCSNRTAQGQSGYISLFPRVMLVVLRVESPRRTESQSLGRPTNHRGKRKSVGILEPEKTRLGNGSPGIPKATKSPQKSDRRNTSTEETTNAEAPWGEKGTWVWRR
jgi:hypothetical protein